MKDRLRMNILATNFNLPTTCCGVVWVFHVTVRQSSIELTQEQETALLLTANPLDYDQNFGIDIYNHAAQTIRDMTGQ